MELLLKFHTLQIRMLQELKKFHQESRVPNFDSRDRMGLLFIFTVVMISVITVNTKHSSGHPVSISSLSTLFQVLQHVLRIQRIFSVKEFTVEKTHIVIRWSYILSWGLCMYKACSHRYERAASNCSPECSREGQRISGLRRTLRDEIGQWELEKWRQKQECLLSQER